ncbi:MAG: hypothetical protein SFU91_14930 [Chloroherpetonaceae bacterium]|nr:hypothetical protein [Chloroherpetonaceae bacterium]
MKLSKTLIYILAAIVALLVIIALTLPAILKSRGFHPDYKGEAFDLGAKRRILFLPDTAF